jgi:hypothetical protein
MTGSGQSVSPAERAAEHICESVTDAQARTLKALRVFIGPPEAMFARQMRPDGSRAVVDHSGVFMLCNLDHEGFTVAVDDHGCWQRVAAVWNPS